MKKQCPILVEEDLFSKFIMAATLSRLTPEDALEYCLRTYISDAFGNVSREYATPSLNPSSVSTDDAAWYGKAAHKIPQWASRSSQFNHKILRAFFFEERLNGDVELERLEQLCSLPERDDLYVPTFRSNYAQMKFDGLKSNGKVFVDDGTYVTLWDEIEGVAREYQNAFCRDLTTDEAAPVVSHAEIDSDTDEIWARIISEFSTTPRDVRTRPIGNRMPLWFYVKSENGNVQITSGRNHENSSNIRSVRILKHDELPAIFDLYLRRKRGEKVSIDAEKTTQNQVYWYGIFAELGL